MIRVGVVGIGGWGRTLIRALKPHASVVAASFTSNETHIGQLAIEQPDIPVLPYGKLLKSDVDAIVIATPPEMHTLGAADALLAGKHVFIEKPMSTAVDMADALVALASREDRRIFVGFRYLFHPLWPVLKQAAWLREDDIELVTMVWRKWGSFTHDLAWTLTCHDVALALDLAGEVPYRTSQDYRESRSLRIDAQTQTLTMRQYRVIIEIDRGAEVRQKVVTVRFRDGAELSLDFYGNTLAYAGRPETVIPDHRDMLDFEMQGFVYSLTDGLPVVPDGLFGRNVVAVTENLRRV